MLKKIKFYYNELKFIFMRHINIIILFLCILIFVYHSIYFSNYIDDDAGISFTFARNLANGYGFVLNPGGERVEGYSNFLWVVLLSIFIKLGLFDPIIIPKILGIIFGIGTLVIIYKLPNVAFDGKNSIFNNLSVILLASSTSFVVWGISGLENSFYTFLIVASAYYYIKEFKNPNIFPLSSLLFFFVAITRPEGAIYFAVAAFHRLAFITIKRKFIRQDILWFWIFLGSFVIYFLWHYQYFSYFVPNTYYAKASDRSIINLLNPDDIGWGYVRDFIYNYNFYLLVLAVPSLFKRKRFFSNSILLLFMSATVFYTLYIGGDWMMQYRFLTPFLPFGYIFIQEGLKDIVTPFWDINQKRKKIIIYSIIYRIVSIVSIVFILYILISPSVEYSPKSKENPTVPFADVAIRGEYFKSLAETAFVSDTATYADPDLGGTSYFSGLQMIDSAGLADIPIGHNHYNKMFFEDYIFNERKPTFLHTHGLWTATSQIDTYPKFKSDYIPLRSGYHPIDGSYWPGTLYGDFVRKDVFTISNPSMQHIINANFENKVGFLGYNISNNITRQNGTIHIEYFWKPLGNINVNYKYLIRFRDDEKKIILQQDHQPVYGWYPTSHWMQGEILKEEYNLHIPINITEGKYEIIIGIEELTTGNRLEVLDKKNETRKKEMVIGYIDVNNTEAIKASEMHYTNYKIYSREANFKKAYDEIKLALAVLPENSTYVSDFKTSKKELVNSYYAKGIEYLSRNDMNMAISYLLEAKKIDKYNDRVSVKLKEISDNYYSNGDRLRKEGKILEAIQDYREAVNLNPANSWARHNIEELRYEMLLLKYVKVSELPENITIVKANYSDNISFLGYTVNNANEEFPRSFEITYYWQSSKKVDKDYAAFVHFTDKNGKILFQQDHDLIYGSYKPSQWNPNEIIKENYIVEVPTGIELNDIEMRMGLLYPPTQERLGNVVRLGSFFNGTFYNY